MKLAHWRNCSLPNNGVGVAVRSGSTTKLYKDDGKWNLISLQDHGTVSAAKAFMGSLPSMKTK